MFSTIFCKIKNKTKKKKNDYVKSVNTVKSICIGLTITIILILEKTFTNQGNVIEISLENSIISCLFAEFVQHIET